MWKGPFPGVLGVGGLLSRPDMLWILSPLSLQMCVPDIFSKLNLTLLFPVQSRHRPPPHNSRPGRSSGPCSQPEIFPFQTAVSRGALGISVSHASPPWPGLHGEREGVAMTQRESPPQVQRIQACPSNPFCPVSMPLCQS